MFFTERAHVVQVRAEGPKAPSPGVWGLLAKFEYFTKKNQCSGASSEGLPGFILR